MAVGGPSCWLPNSAAVGVRVCGVVVIIYIYILSVGVENFKAPKRLELNHGEKKGTLTTTTVSSTTTRATQNQSETDPVLGFIFYLLQDTCMASPGEATSFLPPEPSAKP